jgi:hypothetical protein
MPISLFGIRGYTGQELWSVDDGPQVLRLLDLLVQKYIRGYTGHELWSVHDGQQVLSRIIGGEKIEIFRPGKKKRYEK